MDGALTQGEGSAAGVADWVALMTERGGSNPRLVTNSCLSCN